MTVDAATLASVIGAMQRRPSNGRLTVTWHPLGQVQAFCNMTGPTTRVDSLSIAEAIDRLSGALGRSDVDRGPRTSAGRGVARPNVASLGGLPRSAATARPHPTRIADVDGGQQPTGHGRGGGTGALAHQLRFDAGRSLNPRRSGQKVRALIPAAALEVVLRRAADEGGGALTVNLFPVPLPGRPVSARPLTEVSLTGAWLPFPFVERTADAWDSAAAIGRLADLLTCSPSARQRFEIPGERPSLDFPPDFRWADLAVALTMCEMMAARHRRGMTWSYTRTSTQRKWSLRVNGPTPDRRSEGHGPDLQTALRQITWV